MNFYSTQRTSQWLDCTVQSRTEQDCTEQNMTVPFVEGKLFIFFPWETLEMRSEEFEKWFQYTYTVYTYKRQTVKPLQHITQNYCVNYFCYKSRFHGNKTIQQDNFQKNKIKLLTRWTHKIFYYVTKFFLLLLNAIILNKIQ